MSKRKVEGSRSQLTLFLPIVSNPSRNIENARSVTAKSDPATTVRIDEHRRAALKNLEKSGLRMPCK
jgi:hypothetical protein